MVAAIAYPMPLSSLSGVVSIFFALKWASSSGRPAMRRVLKSATVAGSTPTAHASPDGPSYTSVDISSRHSFDGVAVALSARRGSQARVWRCDAPRPHRGVCALQHASLGRHVIAATDSTQCLYALIVAHLAQPAHCRWPSTRAKWPLSFVRHLVQTCNSVSAAADASCTYEAVGVVLVADGGHDLARHGPVACSAHVALALSPVRGAEQLTGGIFEEPEGAGGEATGGRLTTVYKHRRLD